MKANIDIFEGQAWLDLVPENITEFFGVKRFLQQLKADQKDVVVGVNCVLQDNYPASEQAPRIVLKVGDRPA